MLLLSMSSFVHCHICSSVTLVRSHKVEYEKVKILQELYMPEHIRHFLILLTPDLFFLSRNHRKII